MKHLIIHLNIRNENNLESLIQQITAEKLQEFKKGRKVNTSFFVTVPMLSKKYGSVKILESNPSRCFWFNLMKILNTFL